MPGRVVALLIVALTLVVWEPAATFRGWGGAGSAGVVEPGAPPAGMWVATPFATVPEFHSATLLPSGLVLVAGGGVGGTTAAWLYDPIHGPSSTGSMIKPHAYHSAVLLPSGKVLVADGAGSELYDPRSGTWSATGALNTLRGGHTLTLLSDGRVLVAGGGDGSAVLTSAELYDPATGRWTTTGSMAVPRWYHSATLLPDGKVLAAGSIAFSGADPTLGLSASAEVYDPVTGTWSTADAMSTARGHHTGTLLADGNVLVVGGAATAAGGLVHLGGDHPAVSPRRRRGTCPAKLRGHSCQLALASAELYDPSSRTWSRTGDMVHGRYSHTATLLPSGQVLVTGGYTRDLSRSARDYNAYGEVYAPSPPGCGRGPVRWTCPRTTSAIARPSLETGASSSWAAPAASGRASGSSASCIRLTFPCSFSPRSGDRRIRHGGCARPHCANRHEAVVPDLDLALGVKSHRPALRDRGRYPLASRLDAHRSDVSARARNVIIAGNFIGPSDRPLFGRQHSSVIAIDTSVPRDTHLIIIINNLRGDTWTSPILPIRDRRGCTILPSSKPMGRTSPSPGGLDPRRGGRGAGPRPPWPGTGGPRTAGRAAQKGFSPVVSLRRLVVRFWAPREGGRRGRIASLGQGGRPLVVLIGLAALLAAFTVAGLGGERPAVAQTGAFTEFDVPTGGSVLVGIVTGPDGNLWFTEAEARKIGRFTPAGVITEYAIPAPSSDPLGLNHKPGRIAAGPDGNLWFAAVDVLGRITPAGVVTLFEVQGGGSTGGLWGITAGPDGNLWYTGRDNGVVGRLTPSGESTAYTLPGANGPRATRPFPSAITAGPDGNLWFVEDSSKIGTITPTGIITEYLSAPGTIQTITGGPDGNIWFATLSKVGRLTLAGDVTTYDVPGTRDDMESLTVGPDRSLWFTFGQNVGRTTTSGQVSTYAVPYTGGTSTLRLSITTGPDGNLWFVEQYTNPIGRFTPPPTPRDFLPVAFFDGSPGM